MTSTHLFAYLTQVYKILLALQIFHQGPKVLFLLLCQPALRIANYGRDQSIVVIQESTSLGRIAGCFG